MSNAIYAYMPDASTLTPLDTSGQFQIGDVIYPAANLDVWSAQQRTALKIKRIEDEPVPAGKVASEPVIINDAGTPRRTWTLADAPPPPVPQSISDRQFAQVLAMQGLITEDDALAWVKVGTVPTQLQGLVDSIPDDDTKFAANMLLGGATEFNRNHPMVAQLAAGLQMTSDQVDDIWRVGSQL